MVGMAKIGRNFINNSEVGFNKVPNESLERDLMVLKIKVSKMNKHAEAKK